MALTIRFIRKIHRFMFFTVFSFLSAVLFSCVVNAQNLGAIKENSVNIRTSPSTSSTVLEKAAKGKEVTIISIKDGWYEIQYNNNSKAYVSADYVTPVQLQASASVSGVNIRKEPNVSSEILGKLSAGNKILVSGISGDFYRFTYKASAAYIHKDYVNGAMLSCVKSVSEVDYLVSSADTPETAVIHSATSQTSMSTVNIAANTSTVQESGLYAIVDSNGGLNLRESNSMDSKVLLIIPNGEVATVLEAADLWLYVEFNGLVGFIYSDYVNLFRGDKPAPVKYAVTESTSYLASEIVSYAMQFLGTRYKYGGSDLNNGVDCSGFTYSVFKHFGINLYRSSFDQVKNGSKISKNELAIGDLLFFDTSGSNNGVISHVGIYIGENKFIHSSSSSTYAVMISSLEEDYYIRTYVTACRVIM